MQRLHTHAFFVYGVVVGLAIREALVRVGPHILLPSNVEPWKIHLEALRLVIFLLTITCFYFGSGVFFDKVYLNPDTARKYQTKSYGLDFGLGLVHFLIFFGWSLTLTDHSRIRMGISPFLGLLSAVLLYDIVWLVANIKYDSVQEIKLWTFFCTLVFFLTAVCFFVSRFFSQNDVIAEECGFAIVGIYLLGDATELFSGRPFFVELIKSILPKDPG